MHRQVCIFTPVQLGDYLCTPCGSTGSESNILSVRQGVFEGALSQRICLLQGADEYHQLLQPSRSCLAAPKMRASFHQRISQDVAPAPLCRVAHSLVVLAEPDAPNAIIR